LARNSDLRFDVGCQLVGFGALLPPRLSRPHDGLVFGGDALVYRVCSPRTPNRCRDFPGFCAREILLSASVPIRHNAATMLPWSSIAMAPSQAASFQKDFFSR
jgi:hypothetical protein